MKKEFTINLSDYDSLSDYANLESHAQDKAFDYSVALSIRHLYKQYKAIWILNGEESDIDNFLSYLDL